MTLKHLILELQIIERNFPDIKVQLRDGTLPGPLLMIAKYDNEETGIDKDEEYVEL